MKKFDRNSSFSINLADPNSNKPDAIYSTIILNDGLFCFCEKSIKEILTAETIDPENKFPDTRHSYKICYNIGTDNSFVARTIIQSYEILNSLVLREGLNRQLILNHIWICSELLFKCEESHHKIFKQTTELMQECDTLINKHKENTFIPQLPQVEDLEQHVVSFLGYAKRFLEATHRLLCIFYGSPDFTSNFKSYRDWMAKNNHNDELIRILEQDKDWIKLIAWSRNALDANHSKPEFKVTIENFKLHKGNKFSSPSWHYDFRDKDKKYLQKEASDIIVDMDIYLTNMLTFFEEIFLLCIMESWDSRFNFKLFKYPVDKINKRCPSLYFVSLDRL